MSFFQWMPIMVALIFIVYVLENIARSLKLIEKAIREGGEQ
jgi:hypothetical protein